MRSTYFSLGVVWALVLSSSAVAITIPNGDFETIYKPGTGGTVTGTYSTAPNHVAWTIGVGNGVQLTTCCGEATTANVIWSDASTPANVGDLVNVPGWSSSNTSAGLQPGIGEGSSNGVFINGGGFGASGGTLTSTSAIGTIQAGLTYTLAIRVSDVNGGSATLPLSLDLLDPSSSPLPFSSSVLPTVTPTYQTYSKTYSPADLAAYAGDAITIRFGAGNSSNQTDFDNVTLTAVPEPSTVFLAGLSFAACLSMAYRRRSSDVR